MAPWTPTRLPAAPPPSYLHGGAWAHRGPLQSPLPIVYEYGPSRAWYSIGTLTPPGLVLFAATIVDLSASFDVFLLIAGVVAPTMSFGIPAALLVLFIVRSHHRSQRQRLHARHLWYGAYRRGWPEVPRPPVVPSAKELRPRRLWIVAGTLSLMGTIPAIALFDHDVETLVYLFMSLLVMIGMTLIVGTVIARAGHRGRAVTEHMVREMERARGRGPVQP